ncbi:MASE3 domain-containing protein [Geobacter sp. DSM 9736]|uniref:MASE3 domain-containing protein n=1 Tax=Geobacter sp. DSM 9736 TaxID=1277350 RepID=UPI000B50FBA9|nr:MASE3 domain-containing protein [Geobacter sp. DSM 9736]SNB44907.1 PAS/PAC sensor signal transduction histidine kinase [Geobacter sp. DSM 9736]
MMKSFPIKSTLLLLAVLGALFWVSDNYLLFHSLVEIFSVVIACGIFIIAWNSRRFMENHYFLFLGIGCLFVGALDLLHTLAYKNMGVFAANDPDLPTQLWLSARFVQAASFLLAPIFLTRKLLPHVAVAAFAGVTAILLASIFAWDIFPVCFTEGQGLTTFKRTSEYLIALSLLGGLILIRRKKGEFDPQVAQLLNLALAVLIASELAFTLYTDVFGISNKIGHFLKMAGFFLIYKALIEIGLTRPYDLLFRELKKSEEALAKERNDLVESEEKFRLLAENAQDVIYAFHFEPIPGFQYVSPSVARITGYTPDEFYEDPTLPERIVCSRDRTLLKEVYDSPERFFTKPFSLCCVKKDGTEFWMEQLIRPIYDPGGIIVSVMGIGRDITERKVAEERIEMLNTDLAARAYQLEISYGELEKSNQRLASVNRELEVANRDLEAFNYTVSHDLRAPLANISGSCNVLVEAHAGELSGQALEFLGYIEKETVRMSDLIRVLLNFSRFSRQPLQKQAVDLTAEARSVAAELQMSRPHPGAKISIAEGLSCHGDPGLLRVVLENLIGNAWKYSAKTETPFIEVGMTEREGEVLFFIRDNGVGFDQEQGEKLFRPFQRLHSRDFEGFGIGLATVQRIIERHDGRVFAEGAVGKGATFYFIVGP